MSTPTTKTRRYNRIIALIDMDCEQVKSYKYKILKWEIIQKNYSEIGFYCQVEEVLNPELKGKPIIVQPLQYDDFGGGGYIFPCNTKFHSNFEHCLL